MLRIITLTVLTWTAIFVSSVPDLHAQTAVLAEGEKKSEDEKEDIVREIVVPAGTGAASGPEEGRNWEAPEQYFVKHIAAPEPVPALKYRLYPSRGELISGNSVPYYYRAIHEWASRTTEQKEEFNKIHEQIWDTPLEKLLEPDLQQRIRNATQTNAFENIRIAVYRDQTNWDWQIERLRGAELFAFLLSEVQDARGLSRLIELKTRLLAAEGNYEEALELHKQNFKMASDIAQPPFLISALVGIAQSSISLADLRDMICQTDCPNLYWALASMPDPLIPLRESLEFEVSFPEIMFPVLKDPEHAEYAGEEWSRLLREVAVTSSQLESRPPDSKAPLELMAGGMLVRAYPIAKRELVSSGWDSDEIEQMPVGKVLAIYQKQVSQRMSQNLLKWQYFPESEINGYEEAPLQDLGNSRLRWREPIPLVSVFMPAVMQAKSAETRLQSRIKGLMVLEAIRLHAAENHGKLPKSLDEITVVPVPGKCPLTGKPYEYNYSEQDGASLVVPFMDPVKFAARYAWEIHLKSK